MPKPRTPSKVPDPSGPELPRQGEAPPGGRTAEERQALLAAFQKLGFAPAAARRGPSGWDHADLWVRHARGRSSLPVLVEAGSGTTAEARMRQLLDRWSDGLRSDAAEGPSGPSILVVDSEASAELAGRGMVSASPVPLSLAISRTRILVHPRRTGESATQAHWHLLRVPPKVVLMLATGTLVGLASREAHPGDSEGAVPLDIEGMFREMRRTFSVDIEGSLGVKREEDAMFLLYQLALKETYAPGDQGASLHELVNNPKGPGARLPWFAI